MAIFGTTWYNIQDYNNQGGTDEKNSLHTSFPIPIVIWIII